VSPWLSKEDYSNFINPSSRFRRSFWAAYEVALPNNKKTALKTSAFNTPLTLRTQPIA